MRSEPSLAEQITACHQQLNEMFLLHQEALLQGQLENAASILRSYESCHALHMQFEDDILLPKYAGLEMQGKWDETLYQQEHHKIHDLYTRIEQDLKYLTGQSLNLSHILTLSTMLVLTPTPPA